ncbi:hypothetical protein [Cohnella thailandensis]|uniref:Uncharacterized protein n=1 Tax=Cohnella thailandensis TaxID=557557 RepID=A0A841T2L6_9BACL|nr:hypothetical protein [Cohnella thailandensis]MBB6636855.1 hypothetical protein [Cohnella thailandensis]MBP1973266.1 hypothetical protein [Cohnella thailandensis]
MTKDIKRDIIAIFLALFIIGTVALITHLPEALAYKTAPTMSLDDAGKRLERIVSNNGTFITRFDSRALEPDVYEALARTVMDYGASNDIRYVAELVENYNKGGSVDHLREALAIVNDIKQRQHMF